VTTLYIAGPMTGYQDFNFPAFDEAAEQLRAAGYDVINPADVDRSLGIDPAVASLHPSEQAFHEAMKRDIPLVLSADGIALLTGWRQSRGALVEYDVCRAIGHPAMNVDAWLFRASKEQSLLSRSN
jgi:hypothetical protein